MIDSGQLMERFRLLSRDIQNGLQTAQKQLEPIKRGKEASDADKIGNTLSQISEAWQDFAGWILVSTLDTVEEARANCAPGRVDTLSKITRSKIRRQNDMYRCGISIDTSDVKSCIIETYIPYFEQLLDLLIGNAIKYSPRGGSMEVACNRDGDMVIITVRSVGPLVLKHEMAQLGERGFRASNAKKLSVAGQGYGLYNCKRLAALLNIAISIRPEQKMLYESSGIQYGNFVVSLSIPDTPVPGS